MNLLRISFFASLSIFLLVEKTISLKELTLLKERQRTPLAVIEKHNPSELQLAIPHEYKENDQYVGYYYDDSGDDNDPKEKLMTACPTFIYITIIEPLNQRKLLDLRDYENRDTKCMFDLIPSIQVFKKKSTEASMRYCSKSQTEMYEVGYQDVQFLPVYKICYSKVKGEEATLYSIHRIESPSLLLLNQIKELPDLDPLNAYQESTLDASLRAKKSFQGKKYYAYQFVGTDDMPTGSWEPTTEFLFNYTPITRNADIFKGMIRVDFYIRLYSKKNNKPLTLYSGTHERRIKKTGRFSKLLRLTSVIESFWRIIKDDTGNGIILVTQHTLMECGPEYLCEKNRKIKPYEEGGCIYTCNLDSNDELFRLLDVPPMNLTGDLDFTFQTAETNSKVMSFGEQETSDPKFSKNTDIIDFLSNKCFMSAVKNIDANIAENLNFQRASGDADDDYCKSAIEEKKGGYV